MTNIPGYLSDGYFRRAQKRRNFLTPPHDWLTQQPEWAVTYRGVGFLLREKSTGPLDKLEIVTEQVEVVPEYGNSDVGFPL
jgi:hypothetical protein